MLISLLLLEFAVTNKYSKCALNSYLYDLIKQIRAIEKNNKIVLET